ncbi:hypothetical protein C9374_006674 [Naegleria lovaniensis]|uniref:BRISC and BRCA1-A complex member 2 n=1 Tax=Naegleria lovaniensis TaxID=51637 RepID=A0AA88KGW9_NAELO|nr:uncharacterized protein C9374_006674 [Naegleria lovaniensis]KAG2379557.1 hypothetical protein C9374_006674 [Naegleria lovaniensis]
MSSSLSPSTLAHDHHSNITSPPLIPRPTLFDWIKEHLMYMNNTTPYKINILNLGKSNRRNIHYDRFQLQLPFFDDTLTLHLFYDGNKPHSPFDFQIISDVMNGSYLQHFMLDIFKLRSMVEWKELYSKYSSQNYHPMNGTDLTASVITSEYMSQFTFRVIEEILLNLRDYFKLMLSHHRNENIKFEFETSATLPGVTYYIKEFKSDISTNEDASIMEKIYFSIPLSISGIDKIEEYQRLFDPTSIELPDAKPKLLIYYIFDKSRNFVVNVNTEIIYPGNVQNNKRLEWLTQIAPPAWNQGKSCILEYLSESTEKIEAEVEKHNAKVRTRLEFIKQLLAAFGNPIDFAESDTLSKISFLMEQNQFIFFVHVTIEKDTFPTTLPLIRLQSSQHLKSSEKISSKILPVRVRIQQLNWIEGNTSEVMAQNVEGIRTQICMLLGDFIKVCESSV